MSNFFIYRYNYKERSSIISATVIFCDKNEINEDQLKTEIRIFYEENYQSDKIFIIGGEYIKERLKNVFIDRQDEIFIGIPKRQDTFLQENLYIITFGKSGELAFLNKKPTKSFIDSFLNEGLQNIFIKRGGLITSQGSHHFVFPSGKHCNKFLRTGNILLYSAEIHFIAFSLLGHFDELKHTQIYCDTSSINAIAFSLIELKNRFLPHDEQKQLSIESFSSYEGLYKNTYSYSPNSLLLISASTSANIINYILAKHKMIDRGNVIILYFLGEEKNYINIKDKVLCNLTFSESNTTGIPFYQTYKEENCEFCKRGSYPVEVSGDVFLLEKPKINRIVLGIKDAEKYLSGFVNQFKSKARTQSVLKVNYKENSDFKYEIYIDYYEILKGINEHGRYEKYKEKLNNHINQFVPSNTRYVLSLNDKASEELSTYIINHISQNYQSGKEPKQKNQENLNDIQNIEGTILVVGSCIANGKNLLYISRALRRFDKLRIVYFIGICRTKNSDYLGFLKSNLKQGLYGSETNTFIEVQNIFCNNSSKNTPWTVEIEFLKEFVDYIRDEIPDAHTSIHYLENRKQLLQRSFSDTERGLVNNLFYPRVSVYPYEELTIRKNFAFFDFDNYADDVAQSDIYFTISNIVNFLRNTNKSDKSLKQTVFVRNLLDPGNFNRFNDGIIQACILRTGCSDELSYSIDSELSQEMYNLLETLIKYHKRRTG